MFVLAECSKGEPILEKTREQSQSACSLVLYFLDRQVIGILDFLH